MPLLIPPNAFGDHVAATEFFFQLLPKLTDHTLDLTQVQFVRPHDVIALVVAARSHHMTHQAPLHLVNLPNRVHQYLERVDFFKLTAGVVTTNTQLHELFDRNQPNPKLLELTAISGPSDVIQVILQAEQIFSYWLQVRNLNTLLSVLSELCANAYQHSGDSGIVMIQTHEAVSKDQVRVRVAIGDSGMGIRTSQENRFGKVNADTLAYIHAAMNGRTARHTGRGGVGLRVVQGAVGNGGGYMWIRTDDAAVMSERMGHYQNYAGLTPIPGTQVVVDFHAPLH